MIIFSLGCACVKDRIKLVSYMTFFFFVTEDTTKKHEIHKYTIVRHGKNKNK